MESDKCCAVFGHREVEEKKVILKDKLYFYFEDMIVNKKVGHFYFGGFGEFDEICREIVTNLKSKYSHIKRYYVCEDYKFIDRPYKRPRWLKDEDYDQFIYFDMRYTGFNKRIYFRNCEIIDHSDYAVFYIRYKKNSGAYKAFEYARRKEIEIIQA